MWLKDVDVGGGCQVESGEVALAVDSQMNKNGMSQGIHPTEPVPSVRSSTRVFVSDWNREIID